MLRGRRRAEWRRAALICCYIANSNKKKGQPATTIDQVWTDPEEASGQFKGFMAKARRAEELRRNASDNPTER